MMGSTMKYVVLTGLLAGVAASGCDAPQPAHRWAPPRLATLDDDACQETEACKKIADACGDNEECREAFNEIIVDPDGEETTLVARVIAGERPAEPVE